MVNMMVQKLEQCSIFYNISVFIFKLNYMYICITFIYQIKSKNTKFYALSIRFEVTNQYVLLEKYFKMLM